MIDESLLKSNFLGKDGFIWWIGQVADPKVWRNEDSRVEGEKGIIPGEKSAGQPIDKEAWGYRCKVRIIGYHSFDRNILADDDLPWAHILTSAAEGSPAQGGFGKLPALVGGESVLGFFLDGEDAQQPVLMSCFSRSPAVVNVPGGNPFQPFSGSTGSLSATKGATRQKQQSDGKIAEPPKEVPEENKVEIKTDPNILKTAFDTTTDLGVGSVDGVDYSKTFAPNFNLNLGSAFGLANIPTDVLFADDQAELAFMKAFELPVKSDNGCQDNIIAQITAQIQSFTNFINELEKTALGFIDPIRNLVVDVQQSIRSIANAIASIVKIMINGIRDSVFKLIGKLFLILGITIPPSIQLPISEAAKNILNIIFCVFEKLFGPIMDFIMGLLDGLIGRTTNASVCAAEETAASIISKLASMLDGVLSDILGGLDWLAGGISQIADAITGALSMISQLLSFLSCDALACKATSEWDPFGGIKLPKPDNWAKVLGKMNILEDLGDDADAITSLLSMFGSPSTPFKDCREQSVNPKTQDDIQRVPLGLQYYKCIPPEIKIIGDGKNAAAVPIVSNEDGSILTVSVTNPGKGYSYPPVIAIQDNTNFGLGAELKSTINVDGNIDSIYVVRPGKGYCATNLIGIVTPSPGGPGTGTTVGDDGGSGSGGGTINIGISTISVGIATNVIVTRPGLGYTSGDTITIGSCVYSPQLTPRGSIIAVTAPSSCKSTFTKLPTVTINSTTGVGAELYPIIQFQPTFIVDNPDVLSGLSTSDILKVVQCVSETSVTKPLSSALDITTALTTLRPLITSTTTTSTTTTSTTTATTQTATTTPTTTATTQTATTTSTTPTPTPTPPSGGG